MKDLLLNIYNYIFRRSLYIIADASDSSITLSKRLCKHIDVFKLDAAKVFVFYIPPKDNPVDNEIKTVKGYLRDGSYGFTINPDLRQPTQMAEIQYNTKHKCIGFETLNPTVARMIFDFHIYKQRVRLSVKVRRTKQGMVYYEILRPYEKFTRLV
jgi:hypothetical protein